MSAAVFRERAAMRSSVSSFSSSRSDFAEPVPASENRYLDSPRSSRLGLGLPSPGPTRSTSSDIGLPTRDEGKKPAPSQSPQKQRRNVTMPAEPLIRRIPPLEQQGILKSPKSDDEEVLAPPRPAFYGRPASSTSSLSSKGSDRDERTRSRNASMDNFDFAYPHARSASPAGSARASLSPLPSALKGSRALQSALSAQSLLSPSPRPKEISPASSSAPLPSPGDIDSQRSSMEGWQTAVGGSSSESLEELTSDEAAGAPANSQRWPGTPSRRPAIHSRNGSFQSARSNFTATPAASPNKPSALLPSASIDSIPGAAGPVATADASSDEDEVPLSRLRKRSQATLVGKPSPSDLAIPSPSSGSQNTPDLVASASPKPTPPPLKISTASPSPQVRGTPPASPRALRSMAQHDSPKLKADELRETLFSGNTEGLAVIRPEPSSPNRASRVPQHGRSMSALSTSSGVSRTDSTVTETASRPGPMPFASAASAPAVPQVDGMIPVAIPQAPFVIARTTDARPRGYSPASSSSGSGSGTWSMPLTPRDVTAPVLAPGLGVPAKPRVTFDPAIADKEGPRRVGQPLFGRGLGAPPRGGMRRSSFAGGNEPPERPTHNAWRSVSDMRDVASDSPAARRRTDSARGAVVAQPAPRSEESDDDEALGAALQRKGITPTASMAQISAAAQSPAPILKSHASVASLQSMPAPPGVDPYLFASLPVDQKMQLHQRSQYMMQVSSLALPSIP